MFWLTRCLVLTLYNLVDIYMLSSGVALSVQLDAFS